MKHLFFKKGLPFLAILGFLVIGGLFGSTKGVMAEETPAVTPTTGVTPVTESTVTGVETFEFGFKSVTGALTKLELDMYLYDETIANRDYGNVLAFNLPANKGEIETWIENVVDSYGQLSEDYQNLLKAAGYVVGASDLDNATVLKSNISYKAEDEDNGTGTWTLKFDTAKLGAEKIEFLVAVKDEHGAKWGENNYNLTDADVKAYVYNVASIVPRSGGGGGGAIVNNCSSVVYADWGPCVSGFQFRSVLSQTPAGCSLSTQQQLDASRACVLGEEPVVVTPPVVAPGSSEARVDVKQVMNHERSLVSKVNTALTNRLAGRILLQVEEKGQAWYVEPVSKQKHFMGRPADAFDMMRRFGLGISEANFSKFEKSGVPARFAGRIFLRVESKGEAYYVNPVDMKMHYLGRPADAFNLMRSKALGISNANIRQIPVGEVK